MEQGDLFVQPRMDRRAIQVALERLEIESARERIRKFTDRWPKHALSWEHDVLEFGHGLQNKAIDLDGGFAIWQRFQDQPFFGTIPENARRKIRRSYFRRLLAMNRKLFEEFRTPKGRSLGDFFMWADRLNGARRYWQKEIKLYGDSWNLRLRLGNCDLRMDRSIAARSNYRWSLLYGLPRDSWLNDPQDPDFEAWSRVVEDRELVQVLRDAEDPVWAFSEACVDRFLPPSRFSDREDFEKSVLKLLENVESMSSDAKFCLYWMISENPVFCSDELVINARIRMKSLNPRLHRRYMDRKN